MIFALSAIKYLGELTDRFFEARMQRAAVKSASTRTVFHDSRPSC